MDIMVGYADGASSVLTTVGGSVGGLLLLVGGAVRVMVGTALGLLLGRCEGGRDRKRDGFDDGLVLGLNEGTSLSFAHVSGLGSPYK